MPTGVFRQSKHQRSAAFNVRIAEGRKPSGIAIAATPDGSRRAAKHPNRAVSASSTKPANGVSIYVFKLC